MLEADEASGTGENRSGSDLASETPDARERGAVVGVRAEIEQIAGNATQVQVIDELTSAALPVRMYSTQ